MSRDIKLLHPKLQKIIPVFLKACADDNTLKDAKVSVRILDTLRSKEEQAAIPATNTPVRYPNSMHNWGVAFDDGLFDEHGKYLPNSPLYDLVGTIGKLLGLRWGGDFRSFHDSPHFQLLDWGDMPSSILIPKYGTPENFIKTWEVNKGAEQIKIKVNNKIILDKEATPMEVAQAVATALGYRFDSASGVINIVTTK